ncbi:hypothetical protein JXM67_11300, partial [candidate division WOR-3 bacterium]|nr:hypothetical protein [candidate division WOR-3 bacterium]
SIGSTIGPAEEPASIHLSLSKDTLALAEPALLTIEVMNNSENNLLLHLYRFDISRSLQLYLVTPEGEESRYKMDIGVTFKPENLRYFLLPPNECASEQIILGWRYIVPNRYKANLQALPSGIYKLYAAYPLLDENVVIYSDTIELVFNSLEKKHLPVIKTMNQLSKVPYGSTANSLWKVIRDSNTPYSEGAWIEAIAVTYNYDSLKVEKSRFDEIYPNSHFANFLLQVQCANYLRAGNITLNTPSINLGTPEYDSLLTLLRTITPNEVTVMKWDEKVKTLSEIDRQELNK